MHGIINRALELMVVEKFGKDFWQRLKNEAGITLPGEFLVTEFYSDDSTCKLVAAAEKIIGVPSSKILEMYGEYFYEYAVEYGYVKLLRVLGRTPAEFIENLDTMHLCLARVYPPMKPPLFRCQTQPNGDLKLFYYSKRPGLVPIAVGLIRRSIDGLFGITAEVTVISEDALNGCYELLIRIIKDEDDVSQQRVSISADGLHGFWQHHVLSNQQFISPSTFSDLLPFHIIFNRKMKVIQCGCALYKKIPAILDEDVTLNHIARIARPTIRLTYDAILEHLNSVFLVQITPADEIQSFRLNGQMLFLEESDYILYIASPYIVSLGDLAKKGFHIADLALYDAKRDFILASEEFEEERQLFKRLEELTISMQETSKLLAIEKSKTDQLLYDVLPRPVARELRLGNKIQPQRFESVTILFSGIVNFDTFSLANDVDAITGIQIVTMLNNVYRALDKLLEPTLNPGVYKINLRLILSGMARVATTSLCCLVGIGKQQAHSNSFSYCFATYELDLSYSSQIETVQDTYLVVSGAPEPSVHHAERVANLSLSMLNSVRSAEIPGHGNVKLTVGVTSGDVVAGVIGHRMPRYCLFGDSMNIASRTMRNGRPGRVNITLSTFKLLRAGYNFSENFVVDYYAKVSMKNVALPVEIWTLDKKLHLRQKMVSKVCTII